jgi:oligopeptide transport system substrate-binding protein
MNKWLEAFQRVTRNHFYWAFWPAFLGIIFLLGSGLQRILPAGAGDPIRNLAQTADLSRPFTVSQAEPRNLDPHLSSGGNEDHVVRNLFEGLIARDPRTLEPIPGVAEKWTCSTDGKDWIFTLRPDARWSNGDPITAEDFVYSWSRLLNPSTRAEYAYLGYYLKNGKRLMSGELKDVKELGVTAVDAHTLKVTLEKPIPFFLNILDMPAFYPVPRQAIEKSGKEWTRPENIVSNGAFVLAEWRINDRLILRKNSRYWGAENVNLPEAQFLVIDSPHTEDMMFSSNQLDLMQVPPAKIHRWQKDKEVFHSDPQLATSYFIFNLKRPPLNDKRIRQALSLALDRKKISKFVLRGNEQPAQGFTPPRTGGFTFTSRLPAEAASVARARKLLGEAGYVGGRGFPSLELVYNASDKNQTLAEAIQDMWRKNLNIKVKLRNQEMKVYEDALKARNFQVAMFSWGADYNDPSTFLDIWRTENGNNHTGYSNSNYDRLVASADTETDLKKRGDTYQRAEDILTDELPGIPLFYGRRNYLLHPRVDGWASNPLFMHPLKYLRIKPPSLHPVSHGAG